MASQLCLSHPALARLSPRAGGVNKKRHGKAAVASSIFAQTLWVHGDGELMRKGRSAVVEGEPTGSLARPALASWRGEAWRRSTEKTVSR